MHIKWDERLTLDIDFMNKEHQAIIERLDRVLESIDFSIPDEEDMETYLEFEEAMISHFNHEELLMRQCGYEDLEAHIKAHQRILDKMNRFKKKYFKTGLDESSLKRIEAEVTYLFKMHLLEEDRQLEVFVMRNEDEKHDEKQVVCK